MYALVVLCTTPRRRDRSASSSGVSRTRFDGVGGVGGDEWGLGMVGGGDVEDHSWMWRRATVSDIRA